MKKFNAEELAEGVIELKFMGVVPEYVVTGKSHFYPYLKAEGRKNIYVIGVGDTD